MYSIFLVLAFKSIRYCSAHNNNNRGSSSVIVFSFASHFYIFILIVFGIIIMNIINCIIIALMVNYKNYLLQFMSEGTCFSLKQGWVLWKVKKATASLRSGKSLLPIALNKEDEGKPATR